MIFFCEFLFSFGEEPSFAESKAEAFGYLTAAFGDPIFVHSEEHAADIGCRYPSYVFAEHGIRHEFGWFPSAAGASK